MHTNTILGVTTFVLFSGITGIALNKNNILIILISIELILLAVNLNFIVFSIYLDDIVGQVFVLFILAIGATESAIGLALVATYANVKEHISL
jgi:NADH-quinone oxidoreductase subunit K